MQVELIINVGAEAAIRDACKANKDIRRGGILNLLATSIVEQLHELANSKMATETLEAYIEMSETERVWWRMHNHENERDNDPTELTFYSDRRIYGRIAYWRKINDSLMRYSLNYILVRVIERTVYNMLRDAERGEVPIEYYLWEWYIRNK